MKLKGGDVCVTGTYCCSEIILGIEFYFTNISTGHHYFVQFRGRHGILINKY